MSTSMPARARFSRKAKAEEERERMESRTGDCRAITIGDLKDVNMVTIVRGIIPDDNQDDVQSVDQLDITPLSEKMSKKDAVHSMYSLKT